MRTSKKLYWGFQVIGWSAYCMLILLASYNDDPTKITGRLAVQLFNLVIFGILTTHMMRAFFIRVGWLELKLFGLLPRVLVTSLVVSVIIALEMSFMAELLDRERNTIDFTGFIVDSFAISILVLFWNAIYFTYHFFQKARNQELSNVSLEASKNEIELKNLRSQLNPHFLFNSLNSIRALIDIDPMVAKTSLTTLSNLLRKSLVLGKENLVSLDAELEMVSNYLELEKIRFEERLHIFWDIEDGLGSFQIPPFCMQMLVENAIKHGISNIMNGGEILINCKRKQGKVLLTVRNSGHLGTHVDTGIGIVNTKRRLDLQFKGKAEFILQQDGDYVNAILIFDDENI